MKIIKRGTPPNENPYHVECRSCHSEIEFMRIEAKLVPDQRDGDFLTINCPVCNVEIHTNAYR